jgi:hypothetical protein
MTNLTPGPALIVEVSVSVIEPTTFQESDCAFIAFVQSSINDNHPARPNENEVRTGVAMPRSAILLFDASMRQLLNRKW